MNNSITLKRVSKYSISKNHELFYFCEEETFCAKNLKNLANYYLRQCFSLHSRDISTLSDEQRELIADVNKAIANFNEKSKVLFYEKKPVKIKKAEAKLQEFIESLNKNSNKNSKKYNEELEKLQKSVESAKKSEYKPQAYIDENNGLLSYDFLNYFFCHHYKPKDKKYTNPYKDMVPQTSQQVLRNLFKDWKSYFKSIKAYNKDKSSFTGRPKLPKYKSKDSRIKTSFTNQGCGVKNCKVRGNIVTFPKTDLVLRIGIDITNLTLKEVRIVPNGSIYTIELVWDKIIQINKKLNEKAYIGIDLGLKNLATIVNNIGLQPIIINGKPLVAINQYYNKKKAKLQKLMPFSVVARYNKLKGILENKKIQRRCSKKIDKLTRKRNNKIEDYMHKVSKKIINYCIDNNIGNIVIGKNEQWKTNINLGRKNNQNFTGIPFNRLINIIKYKAEVFGIKVLVTEESYTSKSSFLDLDTLPKFSDKPSVKPIFSGSRITRGLYKTKNIVINADVNGAYNILRKVDSNLFSKEDISKLQYIPKILNIS